MTGRRSQRAAVQLQQVLEEGCGRDLEVSDICSALRASKWLLEHSCSTQLGIGFASYLRLWQLQAVRRALSEGLPHKVKVAEVARRFGFHHPGRFADAYRRLFGELPSATALRGSHQAMPQITLRSRAARGSRTK